MRFNFLSFGFIGDARKPLFRSLSALPIALIAMGMLSGSSAPAQTAHFTVSPTTFGTINVGSAGSAVTLTVTFGSGGVIGQPAVLTQGSPNLDFLDAGTGTCTTNGTAHTYTSGDTCTVDVIFAPTASGPRYGAAVLQNSAGTRIATSYFQGTGSGPQVSFLPGTQVTIPTGPLSAPTAIAVDGTGNIYIGDTSHNRVLKETLAEGSYTESVVVSNVSASVIAVDGAGNVYVQASGQVRKETPIGNSYAQSVVLDYGFIASFAVDGGGNVYVLDDEYGRVLKESPSEDGYIETVIPGSGLLDPFGIAVDAMGNLYITDPNNFRVVKETPSGGGYTQSTIINLTSNIWRVAVDGNYNLYLADYSYNQILKATPSGGSYVQSVIPATGLSSPTGASVDSYGNVYIVDSGNNRVVKENFFDPPSLIFAVTSVGNTSSDSPKTVTVQNIGNADLSFPIPPSGNNPFITTNFSFSSFGSTACPLVGSTAFSDGILPKGASCLLPISYTPTAATPLSGSLTLTDNELNFPGPAYTTQSIALTVAGSQATPSIAWPTPTAIPYGTALGTVQLNASSSVAGTFSYSPAAGTMLTPGPHTLSVTLSPTDTAGYSAVTSTTTIMVNKGTPAITWSTPGSFTYPMAENSLPLNATTTVAGSFAYSYSIGANSSPTYPIPATGNFPVGTFTLRAAFTPTDTDNYNSATANLAIQVNKATPTITWTTPAAVTYPTTLSATQLNATASVPGDFTYSPALDNIPGAGLNNLSVVFTPSDTANYTTATGSVTLTVNQATPTITWSNPTAIIYGAALSATQLNATASTAGSFTYNQPLGTVLGAGPHTLSTTFTPTDTANYTTATGSVALTVNKATPAITWSNPTAIIYGTALSATQLNATASTAGSFTYNQPLGTVLGAGPHTLSTTFTPTDTANYTTATGSVTLTVNKATPTITWSNPAAITYGATLTATQLNATASVAGSFVYTPAEGAVLNAGPQTLAVTFAPTDTTNYTVASANATLTVNKATPAITWSNPAAITYGAALTATQLNATASVAGSFVYTPAEGAVLNAGPQTLAATFTPTDTANYTVASANATLTVNKATPTITWSNPAAITYGAALTATQLNATASVAGSFVYTPAEGAVLNAGPQTLAATFTPTDTANYTVASANATLTVNKATPAITWSNPAAITYGATLTATQLNATASVAGSFVYTPAEGAVLNAGPQTLAATFTPTDTANYTVASANATLTVNKATPAITWSNPTAIIYGAALSATQLNATASTAGSFVYTPAEGAVLNAGPQTLAATFTPTDTANYTVASANATLTVNKATPTITWSNPAAITYGAALTATQLNATASTAGSFVYTPAEGAVLNAGPQTLAVTFAPTDTTNYTVASANATLTVNKATPTITWSNPAAITYGATLSAAQLNAAASVAGAFVYSQPIGTVLGAGSHPLSVTFTPTSTNYATATADTVLLINKATPTITWPNPAAIAYGSALSGTQLNASSTTAGLITYTPAAGTVLPVGQQQLSALFTPSDTADYNTASSNATITITQATPSITWSAPSAITYGTALSAAQLNATASAPGTLTYTPALGTVLPASGQTLSVSFTPTDTTNYASSTGTVPLTVNKAPLSVTASDTARVFGAANPTFTGAVTGAVNGDTFTESFSTAATTASIVGSYAIVPAVTGTNLANYAVTPVNGALTVTQAGSATTFALSNHNLTLTATVTALTSGVPTGTVGFYEGQTLVGTGTLSGGVATYTAGSFPTGDVVVSAQYSGDVNFNQSAAPPIFALSLTPALSTLSVTRSGNVTDSLNVVGAPGYVGNVQFACTGLPAGATCTFQPATYSFTGSNSSTSVTLTIQTSATTASLVPPSSLPGTGHRLPLLAILWAPGLLALAVSARRRKWNTRLNKLLMLLILAAVSSAMTACGGATPSAPSTPTVVQTPAGSSNVQVVTSGDGGLSLTTSLSLTVQ